MSCRSSPLGWATTPREMAQACAMSLWVGSFAKRALRDAKDQKSPGLVLPKSATGY